MIKEKIYMIFDRAHLLFVAQYYEVSNNLADNGAEIWANKKTQLNLIREDYPSVDDSLLDKFELILYYSRFMHLDESLEDGEVKFTPGKGQYIRPPLAWRLKESQDEKKS